MRCTICGLPISFEPHVAAWLHSEEPEIDHDGEPPLADDTVLRVVAGSRLEDLLLGRRAEHRTTWGEFRAANAEGLGVEEIFSVLYSLAAGLRYEGGGGAAGSWTVEVAS